MELDGASPGEYGAALHYWSAGPEISADIGPAISTGANLSSANTYGFLHQPATATSQGRIEFFFNGKQVGKTVSWSKGDNSLWGRLDGEQLVLILVQVWQASTTGNSINGSPAPAMAPGAPSSAANAAVQSACKAQVSAAGLQTTESAAAIAQPTDALTVPSTPAVPTSPPATPSADVQAELAQADQTVQEADKIVAQAMAIRQNVPAAGAAPTLTPSGSGITHSAAVQAQIQQLQQQIAQDEAEIAVLQASSQ
jgi:hypothetical protein